MAKLLIHGGAANLADAAVTDPKRAATERTCKSSRLPGMTAIDLVEAAVAAQEREEDLNAGIGSVVQMDGRIRMDAGICTSDGKYGAVIQIEQVATPVRVARRILDIGYHSILSGDGARLFALEQGFPAASVYTPQTLDVFMQSRAQFKELTYAALSGNVDAINVKKLSTVGAVAIDDKGRLAAACSTGGTRFCYPGRVGDTPIFGAGLYCSPHVAVSCTGEGDKMLRRLTARRVDEYFQKHGALKRAVDEAVADLLQKENGYCGIIAVAHTGETAFGHSTSFMAHAEISA